LTISLPSGTVVLGFAINETGMEKSRALGAVLDASSLIIIAKLQEIKALRQAYGLLGIPPTVFQETVKVVNNAGKTMPS